MNYINGSDMLLAISSKQFLYSTGHQTTYDTQTKERAVKAVESAGINASLFKDVSVSGLSISITANGLRVYGDSKDEKGTGAAAIKEMWRNAKPVRVECYLRPQDGVKSSGGGLSANRSPYLVAMFIINKITEGGKADEDATFDVELQMTGAPIVWSPDKSDLDFEEEEA